MSKNRPPIIWRLLHWFIIFNLLIQIAYASYMIFFVVTPAEGSGPLLGAADTFPVEKMVTRRLYAIECWIAIAGLSIYLAITEIRPRFERAMEE